MNNKFAIEGTVHKMVKNQTKSQTEKTVWSITISQAEELFFLKSWHEGRDDFLQIVVTVTEKIGKLSL